MKLFRKLSAKLESGADTEIVITIRKVKEDNITAAVAFNNHSCTDNGAMFIQPIIVSGTPEEMDEGFIEAVMEPIERSKGLQTSMVEFAAAEAVARAKSAQSAKEKKSVDEAKRKKADKLKKLLEKAASLLKDKKWNEAKTAYEEVLKEADKDSKEAKEAEKNIKTCRSKTGFALFGDDEDEDETESKTTDTENDTDDDQPEDDNEEDEEEENEDGEEDEDIPEDDE